MSAVTKLPNTANGNALSIAEKAFTKLNSSERDCGKGRQMLAYALLITHLEDVCDGGFQFDGMSHPVPSWQAIATSKEAAKLYVQRLALMFIGRAPRPQSKAHRTTDAFIKQQKEFAARYAHLKRAVTLANVLTHAQVDVSLFDHTAGLFAVSPLALCEPGQEPVQALAKKNTVLLDGAPYLVTEGTKVPTINASLSQLDKAAMARAKLANPQQPVAANDTNGANDTERHDGVDKNTRKVVLDTCDIETFLIRTAMDIKGVKFADLSTAAKNAWVTVVMEFDRSKEEDADTKIAA